MFEFIQKLNEIIPRNPNDENGVPGSSARITYIGAGNINEYKSVPDKCVCNLDVRVSPLENNEEVLEKILKIASKMNVNIKVIRQTEPSSIKANEKIVEMLVKVLKEENQEYEITYASPVCDAHWFNSLGMKTINTLGASGGKVHSHNEYAMINSLEKRVNLLLKLIEKM